MSTFASTTELRKMSANDLRKEIAEKDLAAAKMKMGVVMRNQKDTAMYRREKRNVARMKTILGEIEKNAEKSLKTSAKTSKVPAPKA